MANQTYWDTVYERTGAEEVSWYRPHLEHSLAFVEAAGLERDAPIIDVGGGASTLVDDLLARGYTDLTVLDLSATAIAAAQARLGERAGAVRWLVADVTTAALPRQAYAFWHDRAVFHFLRAPGERRGYIDAVRRALRPNGHIVVATFGLAGPERCSGLDVVRYDADGLHAEFGGEFEKLGSLSETHTTPAGREQQFVYCYCRRLH